MDFFAISLLNGLSYGMLLFMLSAGLTLIFGQMGVPDFAHASFYMLGAYLAYSVSLWLGFGAALVLAPVAVGALGAVFERCVLRRLRQSGPDAPLLATFGLSLIVFELVQLVWGRGAVDYRVPALLDRPLFWMMNTPFPAYRVFVMGVALGLLALLGLLMRTRMGLLVAVSLTHPRMAEALGHNVPRVLTLVYAAGCFVAGLAGVLGGLVFVTEPGMALSMTGLMFVVVVTGGVGSLAGAFGVSLLIGVLQTFAVSVDVSLVTLLQALGIGPVSPMPNHTLLRLTVSQLAPTLPYCLLLMVLIFRPRGLSGTR